MGSYIAVITGIHDGDTYDVDIGMPIIEDVHSDIVRLNGFDCPENTTDIGKQATAFVQKIIPIGTQVLLTTQTISWKKEKREKYGRLLANVMTPNGDLAALLASQGLARPYSGEGPKPWP